MIIYMCLNLVCDFKFFFMFEVCGGFGVIVLKDVYNMFRKIKVFFRSLFLLIIKIMEKEMRFCGNGEKGLSYELLESKVDGRKSEFGVKFLGCM